MINNVVNYKTYVTIGGNAMVRVTGLSTDDLFLSSFFSLVVLWCTSNRRQHQISQSGLRVGAEEVMPTEFVRDLGIYIDPDVSMRTHVTKTVGSFFAVLQELRSIH
jgi:hypothetical protein